jgi:hypothetical protein
MAGRRRLPVKAGSHESLNGGFLPMKKSLFVAVAALVFAASAVPAHAGQTGLGLLSTSQPIGVFFKLNDQTTVHFGLGVDKPDTGSGNFGQRKLTFGLLGALEYDIWTGDNWGFGVLPCVAFETTSYEDDPQGSVGSSSAINLGLNLGGHFNPVNNVSVYFKHGIDISIDSPSVGDSATNISTNGWNLGELGIAFWVK